MPAADQPAPHRQESGIPAASDERLAVREKVAFLRRSENYPSRPAHVETVETHMAWVFLTDQHAWKMKKPVRSDFADFSTLEARRRDCEEEVRLNRRLAPNVYLGVLPLTVDPAGRLHLGGPDPPVEWLVQMRRLPAGRMLDRAIAQGIVGEADVRKLGSLLAGFYQQAPRVEWTPDEYRRRLAESIRENRIALEVPDYRCPADLVHSLPAAQLELLRRKPEVFDRRVAEGRVIEAHGDLRPEHICLEERPVIIDCLEFHRELRLLDAASELAFLALECERMGAAWVGELVLDIYRQSTGDRPPKPLMAFYKSWHACTRAKIALWHLKDHDVRTPEKWRTRAHRYLQLGAEIQAVLGCGDASDPPTSSNSTSDPPS